MAAHQQDAALLPREYNPRNAALPGGGARGGKPRASLPLGRADLPPHTHVRPGITLFTGVVLSYGISQRALNNEEEEEEDAAEPRARAPCKSHYRQLNYRLKALLRFFARSLLLKFRVPGPSVRRSPSRGTRVDKD